MLARYKEGERLKKCVESGISAHLVPVCHERVEADSMLVRQAGQHSTAQLDKLKEQTKNKLYCRKSIS
jgi:AmiR/NasT family two-component response regulator